MATAAISLSTVACTSAITLTFQRLQFNRSLSDHHGLQQSEKTGDFRDPSKHFSTTSRDAIKLTATILQVAFLSSVFAWKYFKLNHDSDDPEHEQFKTDVFWSGFSLISWFYVLELNLVSLKYKIPDTWGWVLNVHIFIFFFIASLLNLYDLFFQLQSETSTLSVFFTSVSLVLITLLTLLTGTTPRGAPFLDRTGRPVVPVVTSSIFSLIIFSWVTPLLRRGWRTEPLEDTELWILPPHYRGWSLYNVFRPYRNRSLLYRIYLTNRTAIISETILVVITASLYYAAPYFMNRLLAFIEDRANRDRHSDENKDGLGLEVGLVYVIGLLVSKIVLALCHGHLWYFAASSMQTRVKAMCNIEVYAKTLKRRNKSTQNKEEAKEVVNGEGAEKKDKDDEAEAEDPSSSTGKIVNLMSTDSNRISEYSAWWFSLLAAPIELIVGIYFLYNLLGLSCFVGLLVMIFTLPINNLTTKAFAKTQDRLMAVRDKRVSLMNEVLQGVRQIKFFAWEKQWTKRILEIRNAELRQLRKGYLLEVMFHILWGGSPVLVTIVALFSFAKLEGKDLTPPIAFTSIAIFYELRFALNILPESFMELLQALISVRRIEKYLNEPEVESPASSESDSALSASSIGFNDATITWDYPTDEATTTTTTTATTAVTTTATATTATTPTTQQSFILKDVTVEFPIGELSIVCGATGAGKTLMLLGLLGETPVTHGKVFFPRSPVFDDDLFDGDTNELASSTPIAPENWILPDAVAFVAQTAWLQNATIRDNILFGLPYDERRYLDVLDACALTKDLEIFEDGDDTEIGEKGITLSGGQKQRVALARAVYSRAGIVIMDDVLSAVDAHTARHIYEKCIIGPLMTGQRRTQILVTHHVRLCISGAAYIISIKNGTIGLAGQPAQLRQSGDLSIILQEEEVMSSSATDSVETAVESSASSVSEVTAADSEEQPLSVLKKKNNPKKLVDEEARETGMVKPRIYGIYLASNGGLIFWTLVILTFITTRSLDIAEGWWIKLWSQSYSSYNSTSGLAYVGATVFAPSVQMQAVDVLVPGLFDFGQGKSSIANVGHNEDDLNYYLSVYVAITLSIVVLGTLRFGGIFFGSLRASKILYEVLLKRIFRSPLRFFDTTPVGRILNRFSKDFETIDSSLPNDIAWFFVEAITTASTIVILCFMTPLFIVPMLGLMAIYVIVGSMYSSTSRQLKRMDSVTKSPLFTHFTETINGVVTIRSFGATKRFMVEMLEKVDKNARPYYAIWTINRWLSLRLYVMGALVLFGAGLFILLNLDTINASFAGFIMYFALNFTTCMFWTVQRYTSLELALNGVERVVEYSESPEEAPEIIEPRPPASWPAEGRIEVQDLEVRYAAELDPVLHKISFDVRSQEKLGVVGRTGSGKSTLALSFFRFVEATNGRILIDDIDIVNVGLEDLRSRLTIIPQDPTLFSGTLRSNLDPFDQYEDGEIFESLRRVRLLPSASDSNIVEAEAVNSNVFRNLETPVNEGGKNFSQGQRQLLCLARALLKRSKIVLMDEATASVDFATDEAIQKTIQTEFVNCTILCIAHRLLTVIEYDRILVLDHGQIAEFGSPYTLISDPTSQFHAMCRKSGEFEALMAAAKRGAKDEAVLA